MEPGNIDKYKTNPEENFKVPERYFDTFSSRVQDKIAARKTKTEKGFSWLAVLKPVYTIPAVVILLAVGAFFLFRPQTTVTTGAVATIDTANTTADTLTEEAVISYLAAETDLAELEDELGDEILVYAEQVTDPAKAASAVYTSTSEEGIPSLTDEEIEEYLLENFDETIIENL